MDQLSNGVCKNNSTELCIKESRIRIDCSKIIFSNELKFGEYVTYPISADFRSAYDLGMFLCNRRI
jgi:hypothetical protein